ncbi:hypothetical protein HPB50_027253 [Hyalomma asiaticum]|uniref:Uncharacterized protein n=1 Tax=Hyalomma asiaticum TaxID=266040 RepID=A0ACB7TPN6_HYAAI|nr:hypothetical protein HPB50_027253 [Hyalomma asiaticum]
MDALELDDVLTSLPFALRPLTSSKEWSPESSLLTYVVVHCAIIVSVALGAVAGTLGPQLRALRGPVDARATGNPSQISRKPHFIKIVHQNVGLRELPFYQKGSSFN